MTFEEFFFKKKIDLDLFKRGKPDVFVEFVSHYEQMSEKSFDHTKKYWFNNLRIAFPLSEEKEQKLKDVFKPKTETITTKGVIEQSVVGTQTSITKASGFKPRFKVPSDAEAKPRQVEPTKIEGSEPHLPKPASFKPRFKAGITASTPKTQKEQLEKEKIENQEERPVVTKPAGFKPRFKAGVTVSDSKATEEKSEEAKKENQEEKSAVVKPAGFKPRFKTQKS